MNRAEIRRMQRKQSKRNKTYTLTEEQIERLKKETVQRALDVSRAFSVGVVMNILGHEYWKKTAKIKLPKLMVECESLIESIEAGVISINELIQDTMEISGISTEYFERLQADKELWEKLNFNESKGA